MTRRPRRRLVGLLRRGFLFLAGTVVLYLLACAGVLAALRYVDPPTTAVQLQRRVESWLDDRPYRKYYRPLPLSSVSDHLEHAVVAAEDSRFYEHNGIDWTAVREAVEEDRKRTRGASTITQQLIKNLFLTTHRFWPRKAAEVPLAYMAELILPKQRILELYLEVIEWGRGVYGAEAAARHYYGVTAADLDRWQSAGLAAVIPDPRRRSPQRMVRYRELILQRMSLMGW